MRAYLSVTERTQILASLSAAQNDFLANELKRGKQTAFANVLAKKKANKKSLNHELMEQIKSWKLVDYIDAGQVSDDLKCECGRSLRYQYIVENIKTHEVRKFGINHLQEHTGIPPEIAREIITGISEVDYELDEILIKIREGWTPSTNSIFFPEAFKISDDIKKRLDLKLPLSDVQIKGLQKEIAKFKNTQNPLKMKTSNVAGYEYSETLNETIKTLKFSNPRPKFLYDTTHLSENVQYAIIAIVESFTGTLSSRNLCELLITQGLLRKDWLSSGKPAAFPYVSMYLDFLVSKGLCTLISKNLDDRLYKCD